MSNLQRRAQRQNARSAAKAARRKARKRSESAARAYDDRVQAQLTALVIYHLSRPWETQEELQDICKELNSEIAQLPGDHLVPSPALVNAIMFDDMPLGPEDPQFMVVRGAHGKGE